MTKIYKHKLRFLMSIVALLTFTLNVMAQRSIYAIKGKVSDATGGIPGVTIKIEGTSFGSVTDAEGNYSLNANLAAGSYKLSASSVGYATAIQNLTLSNQTIITQDITIKDDVMNLDEVVVTGSTIKTSRRELGNAISSVSAESLEKTGSSNLISALQGKVPGAQITQNSGDPAAESQCVCVV